jgi:hypothetical protein
LLLLAAVPAVSAGEQPLLFDEDSVFEVRLEYEFDDICMNPVEDDCADVPGVISYEDPDGVARSVDVRIRTRGRWNKETARCEFPSLFVFFDESQTAGTVFDGESMLPLTTHCRHHYRNYRDHIQTEYLAHRIYRMLTDISLRTRLLSVTYADADSRMSRTRYSFFVEHFDRLAARTGKTWVDIDETDLSRVRPEEMATLSLFQYLIANLDWSALQPHNVAMFEDEDGYLTPVPFDFDYSGIVYTPYASPPSELPVYSVLNRYYRGLCWPGLDWDAMFERFLAIREDVFAEFESLPKVSRKERRRVRFFVNAFFNLLDSPKDRQKKIVDACRKIPESMLDPASKSDEPA